MISLGDVVQRIKFSESEWSRIAKLAQIGGLPCQILKKSAVHTQLFQKTSRKMKIPGQSVGRPGHTNKAVELLIAHLNDPNDILKHAISKDIYLSSVVHYVQNSLQNLNHLLQKTKIADTSYTTSEIFKIIAQNVAEFGVSSAQVRELYDFWGFERDENIEKIIKNCDAENLEVKQNKRLNSLELQLLEIKELLTAEKDVRNELKLKTEGIKREKEQLRIDLDSHVLSTQETITRIHKKILELEQRLSTNSKHSDRFHVDIVQEIKKINTELEGATRKVAQVPTAISSEINLMREEFLSGIKADNEKHRADFFSRINYRIESLLSKRSEEQQVRNFNDHYMSPLNVFPQQFKTQSFKLSDENQFLNIWLGRLQADEGIALCLESVAIYHAILSTAKVIVLDDERLVTSWLKTLGWESSVFNIVASPAWVSESDWKVGAEFLFSKEHNELTPRSLFIHNYDVGVPQAYLIPTLKMWSLAPKFRLSKIFLISSDSSEAEPSADVLEHAIFLPARELVINRTLPSSIMLRPKRIDSRESHHTGVKPDNFLSWLPQEPKTSQNFSDAEEMTKWSGIHLPRGVREYSYKVQKALQKYFNEDESKQVSAYHCICPWIAAKYGNDKSDEFFGILKSMSTKAINY